MKETNKHRIYEFNNVQDMLLILPFSVDMKNVSVYLQFDKNHNWTLFKVFEDIDNVCISRRYGFE